MSLAQTTGMSTVLPSGLAESTGLKFIIVFLTLHFSALLPSVLALFSQRLCSCAWRMTTKFQANVILRASSPVGIKSLFPNNSSQRGLRKTLVFWLGSYPYIQTNYLNRALWPDLGHVPTSMVKECGQTQPNPMKKVSTKKKSSVITNERRRTCLARKWVATRFS